MGKQELKELTITVKLSDLDQPWGESGYHECDLGDVKLSKEDEDELDDVVEYLGKQLKDYLVYKYQCDPGNHGHTMKDINEGKTMLNLEDFGTPNHPAIKLLKEIADKKKWLEDMMAK